MILQIPAVRFFVFALVALSTKRAAAQSCTSGQSQLLIETLGDIGAQRESSWELLNSQGVVVAGRVEFVGCEPVLDTVCLDPCEQYTFQISDSAGDGMNDCGDGITGYYELTLNDDPSTTIRGGESAFTRETVVLFNDPDNTCPSPSPSAAPSVSTVPSPSPTTSQPTTAQPTTSQPTTSQPTTSQPTTAQPTTSQPTTSQPTTSQPTTSQPTTSQPTTAQPTTSQPTTSRPTDPTAGEGEGLWYVRWTDYRCVRNCTGDLPCGGIADPDVDWDYEMYISDFWCCALGLSWMDRPTCIAKSNDVGPAGSSGPGSDQFTYKFYVDWNYANQCVQDCPTQDGGSCVTPPENLQEHSLYVDAERCCKERLYWVDLETCVSLSEGAGLASEGLDSSNLVGAEAPSVGDTPEDYHEQSLRIERLRSPYEKRMGEVMEEDREETPMLRKRQ